MEATICWRTALASSLWLSAASEGAVKSAGSSLMTDTSPLTLQGCEGTPAEGTVLSSFAVVQRKAGELLDIEERQVPLVEVIRVLVTVLESVVVLGWEFDALAVSSGKALVSSREALSDVPLPDTVFSVEVDWTLSEDPISSYVWLVTRLPNPFACASSPLSPKKLLYTARLS